MACPGTKVGTAMEKIILSKNCSGECGQAAATDESRCSEKHLNIHGQGHLSTSAKTLAVSSLSQTLSQQVTRDRTTGFPVLWGSAWSKRSMGDKEGTRLRRGALGGFLGVGT